MGREYWHGSPRPGGSKRLAARLARSRAAPQGSAWVCRLVASRWTLAGSADYPVCRRKAARRAAFFRLPARAWAGTRAQPSRADRLRESRVSRRVQDASRPGMARRATLRRIPRPGSLYLTRRTVNLRLPGQGGLIQTLDEHYGSSEYSIRTDGGLPPLDCRVWDLAQVGLQAESACEALRDAWTVSVGETPALAPARS